MMCTAFVRKFAALLVLTALPWVAGASDPPTALTNQSSAPGPIPAPVDELGSLKARITAEPGRIDLRQQYATQLELRGRLEDAIESYHWIVANDPGNAEHYNELARLLAATGKHDEAIEVLESGIATSEVYLTLHRNLRQIYLELARAAYQRALNEPTNAKDAARDTTALIALEPIRKPPATQMHEPQLADAAEKAPLSPAPAAIPDTQQPEKPAHVRAAEVAQNQAVASRADSADTTTSRTQRKSSRKFNDDAYDVPVIAGDSLSSQRTRSAVQPAPLVALEQ